MSDERFDAKIDEVAREMTRGELPPDFQARVIARLESGDERRWTWRPAWCWRRSRSRRRSCWPCSWFARRGDRMAAWRQDVRSRREVSWASSASGLGQSRTLRTRGTDFVGF